MNPEMLVQHTLPTRPCCPQCLAEIENVVPTHGSDKTIAPPVGAIVVCTGCGSILTLTEHGNWRPMGESELPLRGSRTRLAVDSMVAFVKRRKAQVD
jgi:hypothetical protein